MTPAEYQMTNEIQLASLIVVPVIAFGIWALVGMIVRDIRASDRAKEAAQEAAAHDMRRIIQRHSVAALATDLFIGRDLHSDVRDQMQGKRAG